MPPKKPEGEELEATSLWLFPGALKRAEDLAQLLAVTKVLPGRGNWNRSKVMREAMDRGMRELEAEVAGKIGK